MKRKTEGFKKGTLDRNYENLYMLMKVRDWRRKWWYHSMYF